MTVADLQQHLSDLAQLLRTAGANRVAGDLEFVRTKLTPFQGYDLKKFAAFLEQAEAYSRGELPVAGRKGGGRKSAKKDPEKERQLIQQVVQLYERATDPNVTREEIESTVTAAEDLTKAKLEGIARQLQITQKFRAKGDVVDAIRQKILGRKGAFERVHA